MVRRQRRKKGLLILFSDKLTAVLIEIKWILKKSEGRNTEVLSYREMCSMSRRMKEGWCVGASGRRMALSSAVKQAVPHISDVVSLSVQPQLAFMASTGVPCWAPHSSRLSGQLQDLGPRSFQLTLKDHKLLLWHSKGALSQVWFCFVRCGPQINIQIFPHRRLPHPRLLAEGWWCLAWPRTSGVGETAKTPWAPLQSGLLGLRIWPGSSLQHVVSSAYPSHCFQCNFLLSCVQSANF